MALILALAISDKAIEGVQCAQDIANLRFNPRCTARVLRIRREVRDIPILRQAKRGTSLISATKILTAAALTSRLKELGHRAGYVEDLVPYAFRRGYGNTLDSEFRPTRILLAFPRDSNQLQKRSHLLSVID